MEMIYFYTRFFFLRVGTFCAKTTICLYVWSLPEFCAQARLIRLRRKRHVIGSNLAAATNFAVARVVLSGCEKVMKIIIADR